MVQYMSNQRSRISQDREWQRDTKIFNETMNENCPDMMKVMKPSILGVSSYPRQNK